jgi:hypothetical protein
MVEESIKKVSNMIGKKIAQLEALKIKLKILHDKIAKKFMMQRKEVMDSYAEMIKKSGSSKYADELTLKRNIKINQLLKKKNMLLKQKILMKL